MADRIQTRSDDTEWGGPVPLVVFSSPDKSAGVVSAFNLIPLGALSRVAELWTTVATPLPWFRPLVDASGERPSETGQRLDLWFHDGLTPYEGGAINRRPVLYWAGAPFDSEAIASITQHSPMFVLIASRFTDHLHELERHQAELGADQVPVGFLPIEANEGFVVPDAPERLWAAYSRLWRTAIGNEPMKPLRGRRTVPADAGSRPNGILLARLHGEHPVFGSDPIAMNDRDTHRVEAARDILAWRWRRAVESSGDVDVEAWESRHPEAFAVLAQSRSGQEPIAALLDVLPAGGLIAVGPSASVDSATEVASGLSDRMAVSLGRAQDYARKLLACLEQLTPGDGVPSPSNDDEALVFHDVLRQLGESVQFQAALATLHAHRTLTPVFTLPRAPRSTFEAIQAVDDAVLELDDSAVRTAVGALTAEVDECLHPLHERTFGDHGHRVGPSAPLLHVFADYPVEFGTDRHDYLGYTTDVSRSPITPGSAMIRQHAKTEAPRLVDTSMFEISIASTLPDASFSSEVLDGTLAPLLPRTRVSSRSEAIEMLGSAGRRDVFVFVGHGYADSKEGGRSGLVFPDDGILWAREIAALSGVPSLVVLIACNSAATTAFRGGIAREFLNRGASAVVGSTFAVPEPDATLFAKWFIQLLVLPNELRAARWRRETLPAIVRWARLGARPASAMMDLSRSGALSPADADRALESWQRRVTDHGVELDPAHPDWSRALAETLHEFEVIPSIDEPPVRWPVVPYPLFFSLLGYSWNVELGYDVGWESDDDGT